MLDLAAAVPGDMNCDGVVGFDDSPFVADHHRGRAVLRVFPLMFYPGTPLCDRARADGLIRGRDQWLTRAERKRGRALLRPTAPWTVPPGNLHAQRRRTAPAVEVPTMSGHTAGSEAGAGASVRGMELPLLAGERAGSA